MGTADGLRPPDSRSGRAANRQDDNCCRRPLRQAQGSPGAAETRAASGARSARPSGSVLCLGAPDRARIYVNEQFRARFVPDNLRPALIARARAIRSTH